MKIRYLFQVLAFAMFLSMTVVGQGRTEPVDAGHSVADLISERAAVAPGDRFLAALHLEIDPRWHVYWRNAGDAGIAPSITWSELSGASTGEFTWPAPHTIPLETLMNYGYSDRLVLPFEVVAPETATPGKPLVLAGKAEWQICLDVCIWENAELSLTLPVNSAPETHVNGTALIAEALESAPRNLSGQAFVQRTEAGFRLSIQDPGFAAALVDASNIRFYPYDHEIEHFPEQALRTGPQGGVLDLEASTLAPEGDIGLSGIVVVEDKRHARVAFSVAAQPGAIPEGVDLQDFVSQAKAKGAVMAFDLGRLPVWLAFGFLGGLILNLMPCVLPVLTFKANGMLHAASEGASTLRMHGVAYLAGVLVCFLAIAVAMVALRAAGEQVGLGFQLQYPPLVLGLAALMFAVGLNLLGVFEIGSSIMGAGSQLAQKSGAVGAFFTGLLAAVVGAPCVGPLLAASLGAVMTQPAWVVILFLLVMGVGMASPFVILSFIPSLAEKMPKPGAWMQTLRRVLAIPMILTAAWLLWVFAGQVSAPFVYIALGGGALAVAGLWLFGHGDPGMKIKLGAMLALIGLAGPVVLTTVKSPVGVNQQASVGKGPAAHGVATDDWSPETIQRLRSQGRVVLVDFTARWCVTCQMNKRTTLYSDAVMDRLKELDGIFLTADWTNRDPEIATELALHGRAGVPLYLVYGPGLDAPDILPQILSPGLVIDSLGKASLSSGG